MVELGTEKNAKQATLHEAMIGSVKVVAGREFEPLTFRL